MIIATLSLLLVISVLLNVELWRRAVNYRNLLDSYLTGEKAKLIGSAIGSILGTFLFLYVRKRFNK